LKISRLRPRRKNSMLVKTQRQEMPLEKSNGMLKSKLPNRWPRQKVGMLAQN
jgi:hypothetical protein